MTDDEKERALCEAHCNSAADEYFNARPQLDSSVNRRIFYAGHRKAWIERGEAVRLNAQAVPAAPQPAPTPRKMEIPPSPADVLDVVFAEGWNQCCDAYFGGLPPQAPLVVTVFKTNSDTAPAAPQPAQQPLTDEKDALLRQALEALDNGARVRNAEGGTKYQPPIEEAAIEAIRNHLGVKND